MRLLLLVFLAACSSPAAPKVVANRPGPTAPGAYSATLRVGQPAALGCDIDGCTSGGATHLEGVWLEFPSGARWLIDEQPRALWTSFANREVIVRGRCYGEAPATRFAIASIDFATPPPAEAPFRHLGPERRVHGELELFTYPPGSKLAGEREYRLVEDGSRTSYRIQGDVLLHTHGRFALTAREIEPNPAYAAQAGGPMLWISAIYDPADEPELTAPIDKPCPTP